MSTARFNTLQNAAGSKSVPVDTVVDGSAKAWVNFSGISTVSIRQAFNVTSITDNGTGDYTVNFATAMPDANYSLGGWANADTPTGILSGYFVSGAESTYFRTSGSIRIGVWSVGNGHSLRDLPQVNVAIFR